MSDQCHKPATAEPLGNLASRKVACFTGLLLIALCALAAAAAARLPDGVATPAYVRAHSHGRSAYAHSSPAPPQSPPVLPELSKSIARARPALPMRSAQG